MEAFADAALHAIDAFDASVDAMAALEAEHAMLAARIETWGAFRDGLDIWKAQGISDADKLPLLETDAFLAATAHRSLPWN
jgi:malonate decarboxylase beta subunit